MIFHSERTYDLPDLIKITAFQGLRIEQSACMYKQSYTVKKCIAKTNTRVV